MDLVIEGNMFVGGELKQMSVGIEDGRIVTMGKIVRGGEERLEFREKLILPGFVDPHVHFRDPGLTRKEDFRSGTMSAAYGGVTCVLDMPNTVPPVTDVRRLREKDATVRSKAFVDYGLFSALTRNTDVETLAHDSVGFKLFMGSTTGDILMNDDVSINNIIRRASATGRVISVHAEDDNLIGRSPEKNNRDHLRNRPIAAELNAIRRLGAYKGAKINICHITSAGSAAMAGEYGFTTEVTAHHLLFNDYKEGSQYKVNPPLRDEATREMLFKTFRDGKVGMIGSDHAPHTESEKSDDYGTAPSGIAGVETTVPLLLNMVKKGIIPLGLLVSMASDNPARTFGLRKGRIEKGYDADLAIFDLRDVRKIDGDALHGKNRTSVYGGCEAIFPETVIMRGSMLISDGELCGSETGENVRG